MKTTVLAPSVRLYRTALVRFLLLFAGCLATHAFAQPLSPAKSEAVERLQADIKGILEEPSIKDAYLGVLIISLERGDTLFERNAHRSFIPASNQKILTAATALATLGPDFRYTTELLTNGSVVGRTLKGDLFIRGSGDPTLGSPAMFPNYEPTFVFQQWADSLDKRRIEKIDGAIIADDRYFSEDLYPDGWSREDIPYGFAAPSSGLSFAENMVSVSVSPNLRSGSRPFIAIIPETDYIEKTNLATTTTKDPAEPLIITRNLGTPTLVVRGNIKAGDPAVLEQISVEEPALYSATTFRNVLERNGLEITGGTLIAEELREKISYRNMRTLATFTSPPLREIIKAMNKRSNNFYAEQLLRTVAKESTGNGDWDEGIAVMKNQLLQMAAINPMFVGIFDGSGLSRMDLVSPHDMVALLRTLYRNETYGPPFIESLPIMGIDGTLESRLTGTPAQGNVKAKTGSMTGVRTLAGYLTTKDNEPVAFALFANNFTGESKEINNVHDLILLRLVNFSRK